MLVATAALLALLQTPYQDHQCDDPQTQSDMNACAAIEFGQADAELNAAYRAAIAEARRLDAEIDRNYDTRPTSEEKLREAQRAWLVFRDAHCTFEAYGDARGGSMEPMSYEVCRTALTRERTEQLGGPPEPAAE